MPLYEFECNDCQVVFEELSSYDESGEYEHIVCPECGSSNKNKLINAPSFNFTNPVGTDRWNNERSGHDYRYKHNLPNVRREREAARKQSHVGPSPYRNIDDISSGKNFGEVK